MSTPPVISATLQLAFDVERSLVALAWRYPELLGKIQRELDSRVHFVTPAHRITLEAIGIAYRELGDVDWATVAQIICEIPGALEECGGKPGLNDIYTEEGRFSAQATGNPEIFLRYYIGFLKDCAILRGVDPTKPVRRLSGGKATLQRNKLATTDQHPSVVGEGRWEGIKFRIAGWASTDGEISLKLERIP